MDTSWRYLGSVMAVAFLLWAISPAVAAEPAPGLSLAVGPQGQIYFADTIRGAWSAQAQGALRQFNESRWPWLALDVDGAFSRTNPGPFQRITPKGEIPAVLASRDRPITVGYDGNLYYPEVQGSVLRLMRLTPQGTVSLVANVYSNWNGEPLKEIFGIAMGPERNVYFSEDRSVRRADTEGEIWNQARDIQIPGCASGGVPGVPPGPSIRGIAVDASGTAWAASSGCRSVLKITPDGGITVPILSDSPWSPTAVALHGGAIYVLEVDFGEPGQMTPRVRKIESDGRSTIPAQVERQITSARPQN